MWGPSQGLAPRLHCPWSLGHHPVAPMEPFRIYKYGGGGGGGRGGGVKG